MTHALQIDTLEFSKRLKAAGADERLAEAIVEGLTAADTSSLATKTDLDEVRSELKLEIAGVRSDLDEVRSELKLEIAELRSDLDEVRSELKLEIAELRSELKLEIAGVRSDLLKYMIGLFLAQAGFLVAVLRFYSP